MACGLRGYYSGHKDVITNPLLIVEVLSDATEACDRGDKFCYGQNYQAFPSMTNYLLAAEDEARALLYTRHDDH